jgi:hypothetical protein
MEKKDVPQDHGIYGQWHALCYATDENGEYVPSQSAGWEPLNIANGIAWEFIHEDLNNIVEKIRKDELSPLAYYMTKSLMDIKMVARYTGFSSWKVKRHLKPHLFKELDMATLERYASIFKMKPEDLKALP